MALRLATATRNAMGDAFAGLLNSGTIQIRTGSQPTNVADAATGTLLGTLTFGVTAFGACGASVAGRVDANAITSDTSADNSGTAGHARVLTSGAAIHSDMDCAQGSGTVNFDTRRRIVRPALNRRTARPIRGAGPASRTAGRRRAGRAARVRQGVVVTAGIDGRGTAPLERARDDH